MDELSLYTTISQVYSWQKTNSNSYIKIACTFMMSKIQGGFYNSIL